MAVVAIVSVVVTHHASVVAGVKPVVDVCKIVAGDRARDRIDPDLPAQFAVARLSEILWDSSMIFTSAMT